MSNNNEENKSIGIGNGADINSKWDGFTMDDDSGSTSYQTTAAGNFDPMNLEVDEAFVMGFAVDSTGSMKQYETVMRQGLDEFKEEILTWPEGEQIVLAMVRFGEDKIESSGYLPVRFIDTSYDAVYDGTNLFYTITHVQEGILSRDGKTGYLREVRGNGLTAKGAVVVFTDGKDTTFWSSKAESKKALEGAKASIKYLLENKVAFVLIAFGKDAQEVAKKELELPDDCILPCDSKPGALRNALKITSKSPQNASKNIGSQGGKFLVV